jgi:hypothetical protein
MQNLSDDEFYDSFLYLLSGHENPKLISALDSNGQELDIAKIAWQATIAEEQGFMPLISRPSAHITYFITVSPTTGLTGYLCFRPLIH